MELLYTFAYSSTKINRSRKPHRDHDESDGVKEIGQVYSSTRVGETLVFRIRAIFKCLIVNFPAASSWCCCWLAHWWKRFLRTRECPTASDGSLYSIRGLRSGSPGGGIAHPFRTAWCWCRSRKTACGESGG